MSASARKLTTRSPAGGRKQQVEAAFLKKLDKENQRLIVKEIDLETDVMNRTIFEAGETMNKT